MGRSITPRPPSIQRGTFLINSAGGSTGTATISAVDTSRTQLRLLGATFDAALVNSALVNIVLTNSTTITGSRSGTTGNCTVSWELTETFA